MATTPEKELSAFDLGDLYVSIPLHQWAAKERTEYHPKRFHLEHDKVKFN